MDERQLQDVKNRDFFAFEDNFQKTHYIKTNLIQGRHREVPPLFTIAIPTCRRPELVARAVRSCLDQPGDDYQVMVMDDNDRPEFVEEGERAMAELADERLIYYRHEKNIGMHGNWNRCFELAQSEWVIFLHDDDMLSADCLEWFRKAVKAVPDAGLIASDHYSFQIDEVKTEEDRKRVCAPIGSDKPTRLRSFYLQRMQFGMAMNCHGSCFKREAYMKMGGAVLGGRMVRDTEPIAAHYNEDYPIMVKMVRNFPAYRLPRYLYRVGQGDNASMMSWIWQDSMTLQYYCSRFIALNAGHFHHWKLLCTQQRILSYMEMYNSGDNYFHGKAGIDVKKVCEECGIPATSPTPAMQAAYAVWKLYDKALLLLSHVKDVRL